MEIKLNAFCILAIFIPSILGCCTTKRVLGKDFSYEPLSKDQWILDFKTMAYYDYLKMGYKNEPELLKELFEVDISNYGPYYGIIYMESLTNVKQYLQKEYQDIIADSISKSKAFTPQPGKRVLLKGLEFYNGKLLDSLSKEEYKKWIKRPKAERDSILGLVAG